MRNPILKCLTKIFHTKIADYTDTSHRKKDALVYKKGETCKSLFVIIEGNIQTESGKILKSKGQIFGAEYIEKKCKKGKFRENLVFGAESIVGEISIKKVREILGSDFEDIKKQLKEQERRLKENQNEENMKMGAKISIQNLFHVKKLKDTDLGEIHICVLQN